MNFDEIPFGFGSITKDRLGYKVNWKKKPAAFFSVFINDFLFPIFLGFIIGLLIYFLSHDEKDYKIPLSKHTIITHLSDTVNVCGLEISDINKRKIPVSTLRIYKKTLKEEQIFAFLIGLISALVAYFIKIYHKRTQELLTYSSYQESHFIKAFEMLEIVEIFSKSDQYNFDKFREFYTKVHIYLKSIGVSSGGGHVLYNIKSKQYKEFVSQLIEISTLSYKATLTGEYTPSWFYKDNGDFSRNDRMHHLKEINQNKNLSSTRLIINEEKIIIEDFKNISFQDISHFLNNHRHVRLFWISPNNLMNLIIDENYKYIASFDYVIFDDHLILKATTEGKQLEVLPVNNNGSFLKVFGLIDEDLKSNGVKFKNKKDIIKEIIFKAIDDHIIEKDLTKRNNYKSELKKKYKINGI